MPSRCTPPFGQSNLRLGFFNSMEGRTECSPCPVGSFTFATRGEACIPCSIGKFQNNTGTSECVKIRCQHMFCHCAARFHAHLERSLMPRGSLFVFFVTQALSRRAEVFPLVRAYFTQPGSSACELCTTGTHNNESAASGCVGISLGTESHAFVP